MFRLSDLPFRDALTLRQVGQKGFNIFSGPVFQRFFRQKMDEVFRPFHIKWGAIRPNPILLRAPPVSFPKTLALSGVVDMHGFNPKKPFKFSWLDRNQACYNRRKYYITI